MKPEHEEEIRKFLPEGNTLYLHGSRAKLENMPVEIDYDYATERLYLENMYKAFDNGWEEIVSQSYVDDNTSLVFQKMIGKDKVQVSARTNLDTYKTVFESMPLEVYKAFRDKNDKEGLKNYLNKEYARVENRMWEW